MQVFRPTSLAEAVDIVADHADSLLLAGGTDVMVDVNLNHARPETIVSLRRVPELMAESDTYVGAGVTYERLMSSRHAGLAEAARTVGSPQIRTRGTIGGNLGTASPAGDALPFLVAAEAVVVLASRDGERRLTISDFLTGPKQNALEAGEIIVGVEIDADLPDGQAFVKVGTRQAMVIAVVSTCVIRGANGTTRVALGSVGPTIIRPTEAESLVASDDLTPEVLDEFQSLVSSAARPLSDHRATAEYRRHAVGVISRRALERVAT